MCDVGGARHPPLFSTPLLWLLPGWFDGWRRPWVLRLALRPVVSYTGRGSEGWAGLVSVQDPNSPFFLHSFLSLGRSAPHHKRPGQGLLSRLRDRAPLFHRLAEPERPPDACRPISAAHLLSPSKLASGDLTVLALTKRRVKPRAGSTATPAGCERREPPALARPLTPATLLVPRHLPKHPLIARADDERLLPSAAFLLCPPSWPTGPLSCASIAGPRRIPARRRA